MGAAFDGGPVDFFVGRSCHHGTSLKAREMGVSCQLLLKYSGAQVKRECHLSAMFRTTDVHLPSHPTPTSCPLKDQVEQVNSYLNRIAVATTVQVHLSFPDGILHVSRPMLTCWNLDVSRPIVTEGSSLSHLNLDIYRALPFYLDRVQPFR